MTCEPISYGMVDRHGRLISLRSVDADNWRAIADVTARDDQRAFTAATGARYVLLSTMEDGWTSLGVYAAEQVVGHVMWGIDDDGSHWIGGVLVDAEQQRAGVGLASMRTLLRWLSERQACTMVRLSYDPGNVSARALYVDLGFVETDDVEEDEIVAELRV
jgi:diamine N-acetyltransferase